MKELQLKKVNGNGLKVLIIHTRWNSEIVGQLVVGSKQVLEANGCIVTVRDVPGAYELPFATQQLIKDYDACIPIGVLIKGFAIVSYIPTSIGCDLCLFLE